MNTVMHWVQANWRLIAEIAVVLFGLVMMGRQQVFKMVSNVMLQAEKYLGDLPEAKKQYVIDTVYNAIPAAIKIFLSKAMIDLVLEGIIKWAHEDAARREAEFSTIKENFKLQSGKKDSDNP